MNIGIDIVSINRIRNAFEKYGTRFSNQFLTDAEKENELTAEYLAKCWAVKEASIKASGVVNAKRFAYGKQGKQPIVVTDVSGVWSLSVSDEKDYTIATVIKAND